jgi:hypothetical protein
MVIYSQPMPVRIAVRCESCERIYLLAHPNSAKRIRFALPNSDSPYQITCACRAKRYFNKSQILACHVSEFACLRGYADRGEYDPITRRRSD